jgi:hypothetical protein
MRPLTLDDLLPLNEYASRRHEFFAAHGRYVDHYRRVRVGPSVTLVFENRQTLWFRVQELLRVARLAEPRRVQQELDVYNRLLPCHGRLQAALLIAIIDESRLTQELAVWQDLTGEELRLRIGETYFPADLLTVRPEDRCVGAAHWVRFAPDESGRRKLGDFRSTVVVVEIDRNGYRYQSAPLSEDVRQSLLDDLALSDRDANR